MCILYVRWGVELCFGCFSFWFAFLKSACCQLMRVFQYKILVLGFQVWARGFHFKEKITSFYSFFLF